MDTMLLNKVAAALVSPLGLVLLLLVAALAKGRRYLVAVATAVLYLSATRFVGEPLLAALEASYSRDQWREQPPQDAVVVLGGSITYATTTPEQLEWSEAADRFETGLKAFTAGAAPLLIFTGNRLPRCPEEVTEPILLAREAVRRGVPQKSVLRPGIALNTEGDAASVKSLAGEARPLKRIVLVTSAWHMPRAAFLFREAGFEVTPCPADFRVAATRDFVPMQLMPSADGFSLTSLAVREHVGMIRARVGSWSR